MQAEKEARVATQLNPDSVAAQCALGQALMAQGDLDGAAQTAARAVALDPSLPQAQYLLGIADAQRRDWRHAAESLEECRRLAPDFLPAASALSRVYTSMGREDDATEDMKMVTHLTNLNIENFANDNNIWRSRQLQVEEMLETEVNR